MSIRALMELANMLAQIWLFGRDIIGKGQGCSRIDTAHAETAPIWI